MLWRLLRRNPFRAGSRRSSRRLTSSQRISSSRRLPRAARTLESLERRELLTILTFGDSDVEVAVRSALLADPADTAILVTDADILNLHTLYLDSNRVDSLLGLQYAANLETLVLQPGNIAQPGLLSSATALQPLQGLTSLTTLRLSGVNVNPSALSVLSSLTSLSTLDLSHNQLTTASALPNNLTSVRNLDLSYNQLNLADPADLPRDRFDTVATLKLYGNRDPNVATSQTFDSAPLRGLLIDYDLPPNGVEKAISLPTLAQALHYSPVEIYEYLHNNPVEMTDPYGLQQQGYWGRSTTSVYAPGICPGSA